MNDEIEIDRKVMKISDLKSPTIYYDDTSYKKEVMDNIVINKCSLGKLDLSSKKIEVRSPFNYEYTYDYDSYGVPSIPIDVVYYSKEVVETVEVNKDLEDERRWIDFLKVLPPYYPYKIDDGNICFLGDDDQIEVAFSANYHPSELLALFPPPSRLQIINTRMIDACDLNIFLRASTSVNSLNNYLYYAKQHNLLTV